MMKKRKTTYLGLAMLAAIGFLMGCDSLKVMDGDTEADSELEAEQNIDTETEDEISEQETEDVLASMNVREDILSAMEASKQLSGRNFMISDSGEMYFASGLKNYNYTYAYYKMPVEAVYSDDYADDVLAIMEDGSVYNGTTLICEGCHIRDIAWKTHSTNVDAYMLSDDGKLYYYMPYDDENNNYFHEMGSDYRYTAMCRAGSYAIFFREDGNLEGKFTNDWGTISQTGWNNVVVAACACDENSTICTVAAIEADGTLKAEGKYAEEIMSMGELSYIAMFADASVIVGLTRDGELKFAGSMADEFSDTHLTDIAGIRAFSNSCHEGDEIYAVGKDGTFYIIDGDGTGILPFKFGAACDKDGIYCLTSEGEFYRSEENSWEKKTDICIPVIMAQGVRVTPM